MKKVITLILALLMAFSVIISGCTAGNNNGGNTGGNGGNTGGTGGSGDSGSGDSGSGDDIIVDDPESPWDGLQFSTEIDSKGRYVHELNKTYSTEIVDDNYEEDIKTEQPHLSIYNKDVFYRNDIVVNCADPEVMYITDPGSPFYDRYVMFGTTGNGVYNAFSSKDLVAWQGEAGAYVWADGGWQESATWAPGATWDRYADRSYYGLNENDPGEGVYFIFCSATPDALYNVQAGKNGYSQSFLLDCAVSTSPIGPFVPCQVPELGATINGVDYGKAANFAKYTVYNGLSTSNRTVTNSAGITYGVGRYGDRLDNDDHWFNFSAARASLSWQWANRSKAGQVVGTKANGEDLIVPKGAAYMVMDEGTGSFPCIDPTPFQNYNEMITKVDEDGNEYQEPKKYLFFTRDNGGLNNMKDSNGELIFSGTCIYSLQFYNNEWGTPDYSTLTRITRTKYNMVSEAAADAYNAQAAAYVPKGGNAKETKKATFGRGTVEYRIKPEGNTINEGAQLYYNKETGLYHLQISMGSYTDTTYCLVQCIAYDVLGPYRKLDVGEGGLLLGTDSGNVTDVITGPGHHTFLEVYDHPTENDADPTNDRPRQMAIVYHRHINISYSVYARGPVVDEVKFVKNNAGMVVMHANGPSTALQPHFYAAGNTPYYNIATDDGVSITTTGTNQTDIGYLTDGIIPYQMDKAEGSLPALESYVYEYKTVESSGTKVKFTIEFPEYRWVTAIMVYNSKNFNDTFFDVKNIEMDVRRVDPNGELATWEATCIIKKIEFSWKWNQFATAEKMRPGGSCIAMFQEIEMKKLSFEITQYDFMDSISIPEIVVLGRPSGQSPYTNA